MCREIKYLTIDSEITSLKTIYIPTDIFVKWNEIKSAKNLQFKAIDNPDLIDQLIVDRNANHLNQVDGMPFISKLLISLICKDTFTTFLQELLNGKSDLSKI